jgi:hypothetical protein
MGKQVVIQSLLKKREELINERNYISGRFLFTFRKSLKAKVHQLDTDINKINTQIQNLRSALNFARPTLVKGFKK